MKMKVVSTMKGKLSLPHLYGDFKAGDEVEFTKEQMETLEVQNVISAGLIEFSDKKDKNISESSHEYKNLTKTILSFSFGLSVRPLQKFYLSTKYLELPEIKQSIRDGKIQSVNFVNNIEVDNKEAKTKKNKSIKRVGSDVTKNKPYVVDPNGDSAKKETPKGMYVHNPKKGYNKEASIEQQIAELDERNSEGMDFADVKQAKERLLKTQKAIRSKQ